MTMSIGVPRSHATTALLVLRKTIFTHVPAHPAGLARFAMSKWFPVEMLPFEKKCRETDYATMEHVKTLATATAAIAWMAIAVATANWR